MATNNNRSVQKANQAENISGRDTYDYRTINYNKVEDRFPRLKELYKLLEAEKENNTEFKDFTDELQRYRTAKVETVEGLEPKLRAGNMLSLIEFAEDAKDAYTKKLYKNAMFKSAQDINVYFLATIREYFIYRVYPLICEDKSSVEINSAIVEHITTPLEQALEGNNLDLNPEDINGMLYFLTGNCHIKWTKPA